MPKVEPLSAESAALVFAALGDPQRLSLVTRMGGASPQSITALTAGTGMTRQGVSKHLAILQNANLIAGERIGRETRFVVRVDTLTQAGHFLQTASRQWDEAIGRLARHLET